MSLSRHYAYCREQPASRGHPVEFVIIAESHFFALLGDLVIRHYVPHPTGRQKTAIN